jgi:hypothetical protein
LTGAAGGSEEENCARFDALARRDGGSALGQGPSLAADPLPYGKSTPAGEIMQPARELAARNSKEIKGKTLAFPFIPFAESGLFNGLQRKK